MEKLNKYYKIARTVYTQELTLNQYLEAFKTVTDAEEEIKTELKTKTVKSLHNINAQLGNWKDSRDKKEDIINKVFESLTDPFLIGRGVSYVFGENTYKEARQKLIIGTTAEELQKFYTERAEKRKKLNKALENPETLEEFRTFINKKGKDQLTPEQLIKFEQLTADATLRRQKQDQERQHHVNKIQAEEVEFKLHPTKHSKTGADIYTVLMINRVDREDFKSLRAKAKKFGGYYSRYTNLNANPPIKAGFNFDTEEDARSFMALKEKDQSTAERAEAQKEEKQQTTAERMRERAERIIEKAEEKLNQDRKVNTHRRATQAAHAEADARAEIKFGKTLLKIAEGLEDGSIKYLQNISNGAQLKQLKNIQYCGKLNRQRSQGLTYTEKQNEEPKPLEDISFVKYPYPTYYSENLKSILLKYEDTPGLKMKVNKILKRYASLKENQKIVLEGSYIIDLFKTVGRKITNQWDQERILEPIKDFERMQKIGLTNLAILKTALRELNDLSKGTELTPEEKAQIKLKELERSFVNKKIDGFFPTPEALVNRLLNGVKIYENDTILEPSAGLGHIAEVIRERHPSNVLDVNEINGDLCEVLKLKGFNVTDNNFLNITKKYDVIIMNPPFEKHQDIEHIKHAFNLLNPGGRIACIMAGNKSEHSKNAKIQEFLQLVEEHGYIQENEAGSFKDAFNSTNVNTITAFLKKPQEPEEKQTTQEEERETTSSEPMQCDTRGQFELFNF